MKTNLILLIATAILMVSCSDNIYIHPHNFRVSDTNELMEGDIVFHQSKSNQAKYISKATLSKLTHCGIIIMKNNQAYVLEASNIVKLTPVKEWIERGKNKKCFARRIYKHLPESIKYKKYLGAKYDTEFKFDNSRYYCSELVWLIYKEQFGIQIGTPKYVSAYNVLRLGKVLKSRNISLEQEVISPKDLYISKIIL